MTGSTGMVAQGVYPGAWSNVKQGPGPAAWSIPGPGPVYNPPVYNPPVYNPPAPVYNPPANWAGWNQWAGAGDPWSTWGNGYAGPAQPFANAYASMCVDGSFEGYSNSLGAYAYMCVCCGDNCNRDLQCKTFAGALSLTATTSTLVSLLALTFAAVSISHA